MKQSNNTKKQGETPKINNGLLSLIKRYEGVQGWYIGAVNEYLSETHDITFLKGDVSRVVNNVIRLTPRLILLKEAVEYVVTNWGRSIGDLTPNQRLVSTPKGVVVVTDAVNQEVEQVA
jgi:hypothetical protein